MNIYLHPASKKQIQAACKQPSHAFLLTGKKGVGLHMAANFMAKQMTPKTNIMHIQPDESGSIKVKSIRELYSYTRTKQHQKLVIIIDDADAMLAPAQNALLKLLEEPPEHVVFILTAHQSQLILPTVLSRSQQIAILPVTDKQTDELLDTLDIKDTTKRQQLKFIAAGLPAEVIHLTQDSEYFAQRSDSIKRARQLIQGSVYEKLVTSYVLGNDREKASDLLNDSAHIVEVTLKQKPDPQLANLLDHILATQGKLQADGNIRSQLLKLALS